MNEIRKAPTGVDGAFVARLYERHADELLAFFARRTFDSQVAFDLVAETFATAYEQHASCRARTARSRRAWLYGIGRNLLQDFYRQGAVERRAMERLAVDPIEIADTSIDRVEELAELQSARALMASAVSSLSSQHRDALTLRVIEERPYPEIAAVLGISEQSARARVSRALRSLREVIETNEIAGEVVESV